ncbi:MAG: 30S ribosomal protein S8 [Planctomycetota bacterium]|jgi:small subunit ribosomal protein S8|nr:30S ribosomal protein S8 [Planctomycetota bacterium]
MTMTDPIADMLTRIRNSIMVGKTEVSMPTSRLKSNIALVLKDEGFIQTVESVSVDGPRDNLRIELKYTQDGESVIHELSRISKPGCRVYAGASEAPVVRNGLGVSILSTSKGVMSGRKAAELGVGGEVLCTVF